MPIKLPLKVSISPKAMSTLWWISASGGQRKPAIKNRTPNAHRTTDNISCNLFIILLVFFSHRLPHEIRDLVRRAEALGAFNPLSGFCAPQLPNARTKVHIAIAAMSCTWLSFILVPDLFEYVVIEWVVLVFDRSISSLIKSELLWVLHTFASKGRYIAKLLTTCFLGWCDWRSADASDSTAVEALSRLASDCYESAFLAEDFAWCFLNRRDVSDGTCHRCSAIEHAPCRCCGRYAIGRPIGLLDIGRRKRLSDNGKAAIGVRETSMP